MLDLIKVFSPFFVSFIIGLIFNPFLLLYLHKYKVWRKNLNTKKVLIKDESEMEVSKIINKNTKDLKTPRMGGITIIFSILLTSFIFWAFSFAVVGDVSGKLDFISRSQTWLILTAFILGAILGWIDDVLTIQPVKTEKGRDGLALKFRLVFVNIVAIIFALWFYYKLGYHEVFVPFYGNFDLGIFFVVFFLVVFNAVFATSNIDGLDGLAGGIMFIIYFVYGIIAFWQDKMDISALSFVISAGILAFLWFNLSPARFYMSEVGYNALSFTLVILAFITNTTILLPILAFPLFGTLVTTVLQVFWIRVFKKRLIKIAPIHHHFEAMGLNKNLIVARYWVISFISALIGLLIYFLTFNF